MKMTYDDFEPGKYYHNTAAIWLCGKCSDGKILVDVKHGSTVTLKHLYDYTGFKECDRDGNLLAPPAPEPAVGQVWKDGVDCEYTINRIIAPDGDTIYAAIDVDGDWANWSKTLNGATCGLKYVRTLLGVEGDAQ